MASAENLEETVEWFSERIAENDIPSDGLVAVYDDIAYGQSLGSTAKFPRDSFAFKWADEIRDTHLLEIEWSPSRTCLLYTSDSDGKYCTEDACLGFRRLSIIDLNEGSQPMYNEEEDKVLVFNGEIYNYQSLRSVLLEKGHKFRNHSDSEVLLHGYEAVSYTHLFLSNRSILKKRYRSC